MLQNRSDRQRIVKSEFLDLGEFIVVLVISKMRVMGKMIIPVFPETTGKQGAAEPSNANIVFSNFGEGRMAAFMNDVVYSPKPGSDEQ